MQQNPTDSSVSPGLFAKAKRLVQSGEASCVVIRNGKIACMGKGLGIAPLISIYENKPETLRGAFVVDKVIGKAAAMMIVLGGAKSAYGEVMSVSACEYLAKHGCDFAFGRRIDTVSNRTGNGICPLERSVLGVDDPAAGYRLLKETICRLKSAG